MSNSPNETGRGATSAGDPYLPTSGNGGYLVDHYDLTLDYRVASNRLVGTAVISGRTTQRLTRFSLDLVGLSASRVTVDGARAAKVTQQARKLTVTPSTPLSEGAPFTVTVKFSGAPRASASRWGAVGWEELTEGVLVAGQPCGAPTWFPCNDHPSNKAFYRIRITTESRYRALASGRLVGRKQHGSRTTWEYQTDEPMASYLATIQIGAYREIVLSELPARQHVFYPDDLLAEVEEDFSDQPRMIDLFERLFGEYPFADYRIVVTDDELEIPLEAHGMAIFGRNHIDGVRGLERLVAHELAHQWFGNSLTLACWRHIWLHEGFACYAEWLWSEGSGGRTAARIAQQTWTRLNALAQDFSVADPGPDLMFDDRLYKRGALALHALRSTLGDDAFFEALRSWVAGKRYGSVTTAEFVEHVGAASGVDVSTLMSTWLDDHALPKLPGTRRGQG